MNTENIIRDFLNSANLNQALSADEFQSKISLLDDEASLGLYEALLRQKMMHIRRSIDAIHLQDLTLTNLASKRRLQSRTQSSVELDHSTIEHLSEVLMREEQLLLAMEQDILRIVSHFKVSESPE